MTVTALLSPERIFIDPNISSKKKLLEFIANTVTGHCGLAKSTLFNSLLDRERLGSTGLGHGFAVPHARLSDLQETIGFFVKLANPINFDAPDNQPVDLIFCIVIPQHATDEHLQILASLAKIFSQSSICEQIRNAKSTNEVTRIIDSAEQ
ncbi:MAG: PTS system nitrogen regulatory IIA component [Gammaproteobacteria bacterium]|jgi:PTS system nitrogen regulatory IIA component